MASRTEDPKSETGQQELSLGIVFDLEEMAFHGRRIMYEAFGHILDRRKIKLTPHLFCRCCLERSVEDGLARIIDARGKAKMSVEKLADEVERRYSGSLAKESLVLNAALGAILREAEKQNVVAGALTFLPEDSASSIMNRMKLDGSVKLLVVQESSGVSPTADCWLDLAKMLGLGPRQCLALTTCAASCNSALAAGMRCVVIPDEFTGFQDFSGADWVVEGAEKLSARKLMALLRTRTCSFRGG